MDTQTLLTKQIILGTRRPETSRPRENSRQQSVQPSTVRAQNPGSKAAQRTNGECRKQCARPPADEANSPRNSAPTTSGQRVNSRKLGGGKQSTAPNIQETGRATVNRYVTQTTT